MTKPATPHGGHPAGLSHAGNGPGVTSDASRDTGGGSRNDPGMTP